MTDKFSPMGEILPESTYDSWAEITPLDINRVIFTTSEQIQPYLGATNVSNQRGNQTQSNSQSRRDR